VPLSWQAAGCRLQHRHGLAQRDTGAPPSGALPRRRQPRRAGPAREPGPGRSTSPGAGGPNARSNAATWYTCKGLPPRRWCAAYPWTTSRASAWIFHVYRRSGLLQPAACGSASHAASGRRHPMAHTRWAVVVRRRAAWRSRHQCNPGDPPPHGVAPPPQCPGQSAHGDGS
jgi:hypothetical protein